MRDVGFTTGALTVLAVTTAALRSPWRLRVRAALWFYVTVALFFEGTLSDVAHAIAVGIGFLVGQRLFGVEPGFGPRTRRETRMLAFGGLIAIGLTELVVLLFPGRGPFGSVAGLAGPTADVVIDLVIIAVVANALRLGKRWAWWLTVGYGLLNVGAAVLALVLIFSGHLPNGAPIALGGALLWIGEIGLLVFNRGAFRVPLRRRVPGGVAATEGDSMARARAMLTTVGGSTMSWMTTWPEKRYYFTRTGAATSATTARRGGARPLRPGRARGHDRRRRGGVHQAGRAGRAHTLPVLGDRRRRRRPRGRRAGGPSRSPRTRSSTCRVSPSRARSGRTCGPP